MFRDYNRSMKTLLAILKILIVCSAIALIILFIKIMGDPIKEIDDIIGLAFGCMSLVSLVIGYNIAGSDPYDSKIYSKKKCRN